MKGVSFVSADNRPNSSKISLAAVNTLPPGAGIGVHAHESNEEVYFIIDGDGVYTDSDGKDYPVAKGDFTLCRQGETHGLLNNGAHPLVYAAVIVESSK